MAVLKCKMCGGELQIVDGENICECEYCGSKQTVPTLDDDKKAKLYERAHKLRFNCDFDKAASVYENIINEFPDDAEGYWGLVLCNYGIEYVDDPATGKKVPTCHRSSFDSLLENPDFEMVMENSEDEVRTLYRQEARQIEELRRQINEVSGKEEPYDIFICYKETDAHGERTLDSVLAQDVYEELTDKGYRVFFSRISLEDKLGTEYEPYIFAALTSAKLMLAFGTSYENYNAVWVKNEWGRFVKLLAKDKSKHLIPCYKDIDPSFDLPAEFAKFQAQDMGKVGATQDLLRGIDKILRPAGDEGTSNRSTQGLDTDAISAAVAAAVSTGGGSNVSALLQRGFLALEDKEWDSANNFFEDALNQNAMSGEAYFGKLMADVQVSSKEDLRNLDMPFDDNKNYQKIVRFGEDNLKAELEGDIHFIKERNENTRKTNIYNEAIGCINSKKFDEAIRKFESLIGFKDAEEKIAECKKLKVEEIDAYEQKLDSIANAIMEKYDGSPEESLKKHISESNQKITEVNNEISRLDDLKPYLPDLIAKLEQSKSKKEETQNKINTLQNEKNSLGVFSGKRKKEIDAEVINLNTILSQVSEEIANVEIQVGEVIPENIDAKITNLKNQILKLEADKSEYELKLSNLHDEPVIRMSYNEAIKALEEKQLLEDFKKKYRNLYLQKPSLYIKLEKSFIFGTYKGKPVTWKVIASNGEKKLLISECGIDVIPYNKMQFDVTWETCTLRKYMNNEILNEMFTAEEQKLIMKVTNKNPNNPMFGTPGGKDTEDKLFLLSIDEANKYFKNDGERVAKSTGYAKSKGAYRWWLRSPGHISRSAAVVDKVGSVSNLGDYVSSGDGAVRPACWVDLSNL